MVYLIQKLVILNLSVHYEPLTEITAPLKCEQIVEFLLFSFKRLFPVPFEIRFADLANFLFFLLRQRTLSTWCPLISLKSGYRMPRHLRAHGCQSFLLSSPGHSPNLLRTICCQITPYPSQG